MNKIRVLFAFVILTVTVPAAWSQQRFPLPSVASADDAALAKAMPVLAKEVIAGYTDANRGRYLSNLFRLQMVAADYDAANSTVQQLSHLSDTSDPKRSTANLIPDELMVRSDLRQVATRV
jgi:uncharacterized protein